MKTLVIYDSAFGNTKVIAEAMAKDLGADIKHVTEVKKESLKTYEYIIVGSPIQGWRPLVPMQGFLASLSADSLSGVKVAAFDTRMNIFIHGDAVQKMAGALKAAGAEIVGTEFFYVKGQKGPIKEGEIERAIKWAKSLVKG